MNKIIVSAALLILSSVVYAAELTKESLQGSWRVLTLSDQADEDEDYWEFNGDKFIQNLAGHKVSPDEFKIKGNDIDLGYYQIKVLQFDGKTMTADMAGFKYTLKKK